MREIKFRAWFANRMWYAITQLVFSATGIRIAYLNNDENDFDIPADTWTGKDDYEIMQYTGLHDKTGREIYEGDIVDWPDGVGMVHWDERSAQFLHTYQEKINPGWYRPSKALWGKVEVVEVIGNIYEHKELLE